MSGPDYPSFFSAACGQNRQPYDYQRRLAEEECISRLISVPTGLGKTAAVILAWLWNYHRFTGDFGKGRQAALLKWSFPRQSRTAQTLPVWDH